MSDSTSETANSFNWLITALGILSVATTLYYFVTMINLNIDPSLKIPPGAAQVFRIDSLPVTSQLVVILVLILPTGGAFSFLIAREIARYERKSRLDQSPIGRKVALVSRIIVFTTGFFFYGIIGRRYDFYLFCFLMVVGDLFPLIAAYLFPDLFHPETARMTETSEKSPCRHCGAENSLGVTYCRNCGKRLEE